MDESPIELLRQELQSEEINIRVQTIETKLRIVIMAIGKNEAHDKLIPYLKDLIRFEDDEILFAVAKQIASVFHLLDDKTAFLPLLNELAA